MPMMVVRGQTAHFIVSYDDTLSNGIALADAVLAQCEQDLSAINALFGGIMPAASSLPFQVSLVPGAGGASHPGCLATAITCYINAGSDTQGIPALVDAEVAEVFMATQAKGVDCAASNGEALSRVVPTVLYPSLRNRFSTGNAWLNSTNPARFDWVTNTEPSDQNLVPVGCGSLFLNYLAYQLNFSWPEIINAGAPTLGETAAALGVPNAFSDFAALLAYHYPPGMPVTLEDDDPFPLADPPMTGDLGADQFTFAGDRTQIRYETQTPIPNQGALIQYQGPEGDDTFTGDQIAHMDSDLGSLLTVVLRPNTGAGVIGLTILVPKAYGVTRENPVTFGTIAIKTTSRGSVDARGVGLTYSMLPLLGQASQVFLP